MATLAADKPKFRTEPRAYDALVKHLAEHPEIHWDHPDPNDVSDSAIYVEDRWQPIFAAMRAKGPLQYVEQSPFGAHWNVVGHKAVAHIEALPELFSSSW